MPKPWKGWDIQPNQLYPEPTEPMPYLKTIFSITITDYSKAIRLIFSIGAKNTLLLLVLQVCVSFFSVGILYATKSLFDQIIATNRNFDQVLFWLIVLGGCQLLFVLTNQWLKYLGQLQQQQITDHMGGMIMEKSIAIPYSYFEDNRYHDSLLLAQKQSLYRLPQLMQHFQQLITNFLSLGFLMVYFFTLITSYAWIILLVVLPLAMVKWYSGYALHQLEKKLIPLERQAGYFHQVMSSVSHQKKFGHWVLDLLS